jgi:hypothetical protein
VIDRTRLVFLLRPQTHLWLAAGVGAVWALMPALALLAALAGLIGGVAVWLVAVLGYVVGIALLVGAVAVLIIGFVAANRESNGGPGCAGVVGAAVLLGAGIWLLDWWHTNSKPLWQIGLDVFFWGVGLAGQVLTAWLNWGVAWLPLLVGLLASMAAALTALTTVLLLRAGDGWRAAVRRVRYFCPTGHTGRVEFGCTHCRRWEGNLRPSVYGLAGAACECGRTMPTTDLFGRGRAELLRRCGTCHTPLTHPHLGSQAELQVHMWGANAGEWAAAAAVAAERSGAHASGRPPNAILMHGQSLGRSLVYLSAGGGGDRPPPDGLILLLDVDPRDDSADGASEGSGVDEVLDQLERSRVGAVPVAVCVRWQGGPYPDGPASTADLSAAIRRGLLAAGLTNAVGLLERRFTRLRFFALTPGPGDLAGCTSESSAVIRWATRADG